jgi:hypothetical protein
MRRRKQKPKSPFDKLIARRSSRLQWLLTRLDDGGLFEEIPHERGF